MPLSAHEGDPRGGAPEPVVLQPDVTLSQKKRKARHDREVAVLRMLKEGAASNSSFRFDHARIWRDVTMPNLALIPVADDIAASDVMLGVVIERIFEGITCFTPTTSAKESTASATDFRIDASGAIQGANENLAKLVAPHFGTLTVGATDDSTRVRVVAPAVALARIMDLIGDVDGDKVRRPLATLPNDREPVALGRKSSVDMTRSPKGQLRSKPDATQLPPIAIKLSTTSHVLSPEHIPSIVGAGVPKRFHECGLRLLYSTNEHGMSLLTLYNRVKTASPTLLVIRDTKDRVFGCYAAAPWKASSARYYGTGESFVFGTDGPDVVKVYKWSRENSFFQFTSHSFLAIGGGAGSHFALWVDEDLLMGTTSACSTFASPPLTNTLSKDESNCTEFKIVTLEVWAFDAHMSH
ncbi:unnamed protein product [Chondrus crispus]|uniref:Oxidation resistance protein 1 n=1 Tax=Chondrus crispus TaxID=2769 RepID=R7QKW5_CHOCR|nr:unnamed protein product [Chondrus crispus]CDF38015.1 unnamed protein product [Chondrus crispus]|eukprot:XP_005717884.1 unnamed protein product [Chondrus crispus]